MVRVSLWVPREAREQILQDAARYRREAGKALPADRNPAGRVVRSPPREPAPPLKANETELDIEELNDRRMMRDLELAREPARPVSADTKELEELEAARERAYAASSPGPRRAVKTPRSTRKVGRNAVCPCGSGKKYKRCCGRA